MHLDQRRLPSRLRRWLSHSPLSLSSYSYKSRFAARGGPAIEWPASPWTTTNRWRSPEQKWNSRVYFGVERVACAVEGRKHEFWSDVLEHAGTLQYGAY